MLLEKYPELSENVPDPTEMEPRGEEIFDLTGLILMIWLNLVLQLRDWME